MSAIVVFVNGRARQVAPEVTVGALVRECGLPGRSTLVERNGAALARRQWEEVRVEHGDRLELMRIVAGG
jgi:thiamine biosynthesis protein ThiS